MLEPANTAETDSARVDRETRAANTARITRTIKAAATGASRNEQRIAGLKKEIARFETAARKDGNPRAEAISDLRRRLHQLETQKPATT